MLLRCPPEDLECTQVVEVAEANGKPKINQTTSRFSPSARGILVISNKMEIQQEGRKFGGPKTIWQEPCFRLAGYVLD